MAGESSLPVQYYADDFQILTVPFTSAAVNDPTAILYADRDMIIDEIVVGVHAVGGVGYSFDFEASTNPVGQSGVSMCTINIDTANVTVGDTLVATTDNVLRYSLTGVLQTTTLGSTAINGVIAGVQSNCIPKGSWLVMDVAGTVGSGRVIVQIRFRSRLK
jgi:hypothetical protein